MAGGVVDGDDSAIWLAQIIAPIVAFVSCLLFSRIASDDAKRLLVVDLRRLVHVASPFPKTAFARQLCLKIGTPPNRYDSGELIILSVLWYVIEILEYDKRVTIEVAPSKGQYTVHCLKLQCQGHPMPPQWAFSFS